MKPCWEEGVAIVVLSALAAAASNMGRSWLSSNSHRSQLYPVLVKPPCHDSQDALSLRVSVGPEDAPGAGSCIHSRLPSPRALLTCVTYFISNTNCRPGSSKGLPATAG